MKQVLGALLALGLVFGLAMNASSKGSGTYVIDWHKGGKKTPLSFTKHKAAGVKCASCHPKHKDGSRHMSNCGKCHSSKASAMKIGHKMCKGCHRKGRGPTSCKGCHP